MTQVQAVLEERQWLQHKVNHLSSLSSSSSSSSSGFLVRPKQHIIARSTAEESSIVNQTNRSGYDKWMGNVLRCRLNSANYRIIHTFCTSVCNLPQSLLLLSWRFFAYEALCDIVNMTFDVLTFDLKWFKAYQSTAKVE